MLLDWRLPTRYFPYIWCVRAMVHRVQQHEDECTIKSIAHEEQRTRILVHRKSVLTAQYVACQQT